MQMKRSKKQLSLILCMALIVATALINTGCNGSGGNGTPSGAETEGKVWMDGDVLGEGSTEFSLTVVDGEGSEVRLEIHTDKETVGDALVELGVIAGDNSEYGLYVKTVNGITADYDKDGKYWAFYINEEYAQTGVTSTNITEEDSYSFKVQ